MVRVLVLKTVKYPEKPPDTKMGTEHFMAYEQQLVDGELVEAPIRRVRPARVKKDPLEYEAEVESWQRAVAEVNAENRVIEQALNASKKLCGALDPIPSTLKTAYVWKLFVNMYGSPERLAVSFDEDTFYVSNNKVVRVPDDVQRIAVKKHCVGSAFEVSHLNGKIIAQFHRPKPIVIPLINSLARLEMIRKVPLGKRELLALVTYFKNYREDDYKELVRKFKYRHGTLVTRDGRRSAQNTDKIFGELETEVLAMVSDVRSRRSI